MDTILIVDDDEVVISGLKKVAKASGLMAEAVTNGSDALEILSRRSYDLILMDINMTGIDGFETVQAIRHCEINTPIIFVSGRKEDFDTLYGLDIGADDYVTKPFNPVTLGAKMKALIRRSRSSDVNADPVLTAGPFSYNTSSLHFLKNDEEIVLTSKENAIMRLFLENVNRVFTKDILYEMVWGNTFIDDNTIMVYINRLRQKIEDEPSNPKYIQTVRGIGYRFSV